MLSTELLDYYSHISQQVFTVVDVETTGYRPPNSRVIEVSVLQATLKDGIIRQQTHLVNPEVTVPAEITRFTEISQAMVDSATLAKDIWGEYLPLLTTGILTAHNLSFDYAFLQAEFQQIGVEFARPAMEQLCTVVLARLMLPDLPSRSLPNLVEHFGFAVGRSHRAAADTLACWQLAEQLLTEIQTESRDRILARFMCQWLPLKDAAVILGVPSKTARSLLDTAKVESRLVGQYQTRLYQRGAVEQVYWQRHGETQLSLL